MVETDQTDEAIIALLQKDGRTSNREIARQLDLSEGTVRQRLKRLHDAKAIRLGAVMDAGRMGLTASAFLHITVAAPKLRKVAKTIAKIDAASFVGLTLGDCNLIALLTAHDRAELADLIHVHVAPIDGILNIRSFELVTSYKHRYDITRIR